MSTARAVNTAVVQFEDGRIASPSKNPSPLPFQTRHTMDLVSPASPDFAGFTNTIDPTLLQGSTKMDMSLGVFVALRKSWRVVVASVPFRHGRRRHNQVRKEGQEAVVQKEGEKRQQCWPTAAWPQAAGRPCKDAARKWSQEPAGEERGARQFHSSVTFMCENTCLHVVRSQNRMLASKCPKRRRSVPMQT